MDKAREADILAKCIFEAIKEVSVRVAKIVEYRRKD